MLFEWKAELEELEAGRIVRIALEWPTPCGNDHWRSIGRSR